MDFNNLDFKSDKSPDENDTQESPTPQAPAPAEETKETVPAGSAEEADDLPF